ncbi:RNA-binding cell elongation regulator Jag/EloR [uncultured Enterococcus sp.]|uniref:RNA-binding cell elongation regulator Jag/EloR n=1 Tax=uncultured Enterococcus sp. TaxID=167972 RepID=UPI0025DA9EA1|nr:RNA-binding cell elongation regulator Jag/EloR [uncultured Enterococcus sp.]
MPMFTASTVQKAIDLGLNTLGITREDAVIEVLQDAKKGLFGFGKKNAQVSIEPKSISKNSEIVSNDQVIDSIIDPSEATMLSTNLSTEEIEPEQDSLEELRAYLEMIVKQLVLSDETTVTVERKKDVIMYQINTTKQGLVIGKHGKTLNAIQYLAQVFLHRQSKEKRSIVVNVGDYREKRQEILERLAERTAQKVIQTKRPIFLEPMPAFERKQIHAVLSKHDAVQTHSEGDEPYRYLVIELKK